MAKRILNEIKYYNDSMLAVLLLALILTVSVLGGKAWDADAKDRIEEDYTIISEDGNELIVYDNQTYIVYKAVLVRQYLARPRYDIKSYFASNGLPYKYDVEKDEICEIEHLN